MAIDPQKLNDLADKHYAWLTDMDWRPTDLLIAGALISSEVGETIDAYLNCGGDTTSKALAEEMADIVLRCLGVLREHGGPGPLNICWTYALPCRGNSLMCDLGEVLVEVAKFVNMSRAKNPDMALTLEAIANVVRRVMMIAAFYNVGLEAAVVAKIKKNRSKGNYKDRAL